MRPVRRVMVAVVAALRDNATLVAIVDNDEHRIRRRVGAANVPGVEYTVISDALEENTAPIDVQFSMFAETYAALDSMEEQLLLTLYRDRDITLGGVKMIVEYLGGRAVEDPAEGVLHRAVDLRFTPARS